jgi:hypothetical protein
MRENELCVIEPACLNHDCRRRRFGNLLLDGGTVLPTRRTRRKQTQEPCNTTAA